MIELEKRRWSAEAWHDGCERWVFFCALGAGLAITYAEAVDKVTDIRGVTEGRAARGAQPTPFPKRWRVRPLRWCDLRA